MHVRVAHAAAKPACIGLAEPVTDDDRHQLLVAATVRAEAARQLRKIVVGAALAEHSARIRGNGEITDPILRMLVDDGHRGSDRRSDQASRPE